MKRLLLNLLSISLVLSIITSCGGTKEITVPCVENGNSNPQFFKAAGSAKSKDMTASKDKAMLSTKQILASLIGSTMKSVTDNYLAQTNNASASQKFENITREIVNQQLKSISVTCSKTQKTKDGQYETFISLEMPKSQMISSILDRISQDPSLSSTVDTNAFKQMAEKEFNK